MNGLSEENVAERISYEMRRRGWSQERMAKEMADAGYPLHQSAISKIVNPKGGKRRTIGVDEAIGFARVFDIPVESLMLPIEAVKSAEVRALYEEIEALSAKANHVAAEIAACRQRIQSLTSQNMVLA